MCKNFGDSNLEESNTKNLIILPAIMIFVFCSFTYHMKYCFASPTDYHGQWHNKKTEVIGSSLYKTSIQFWEQKITCRLFLSHY